MNNNFNWRLLNKSECYDTIVSWWKEHKAFNNKIIEYSSMPNRVFIVSRDGVDLYAIAVYISDSDICWIGWITSNPNSPPRHRIGALDFLHSIISTVMKSQGFKQIISKTTEKGLIKALENNSYMMVEQSNFFLKKL